MDRRFYRNGSSDGGKKSGGERADLEEGVGLHGKAANAVELLLLEEPVDEVLGARGHPRALRRRSE